MQKGEELEELGQEAKPRKYNQKVTWESSVGLNTNGRRRASV